MDQSMLHYYKELRDSLYILSAMNQFSLRPDLMLEKGIHVDESRKELMGLLRMALFSKDIVIPHHGRALQDMRTRIAGDLRSRRRRAVVPIFISTAWFLFAIALGIYADFGNYGNEFQALDLSLGLVLSWLPVLILSTIVDRNFTATDVIVVQLNRLVNGVIEAWRSDAEDPTASRARMENYVKTFGDDLEERQKNDLQALAEGIRDKCEHMKDPFEFYAGQGRLPWHYGCAHSILSSIERDYIAKHGRPWFRDVPRTRVTLVLGDPTGIPFQL